MSVAYVLARGRAARTALMLDAIAVSRPSGPPVFDDNTGEYTPAPAGPPVYTGRADVKPRATSGSGEVDAGERQVVLRDYDVAIPWTAAPIVEVDDQVTVTASPDPTFVGRVLTVTAVEHGARRTAHHFSAEDRS